MLTPSSRKNIHNCECPIRIVVADDNEVVRNSLKLFIESTPDLELVGEAVDGYEAISVCTEKQPDVILLDMDMPNLCGIDATRIIRKRFPRMYILVLSSIGDNGNVNKVLKAGADNFVPKQISADELGKIIQTAVQRDGFSPGFRWLPNLKPSGPLSFN
jgi:DNA-binding NarL/FixJ family response regulator